MDIIDDCNLGPVTHVSSLVLALGLWRMTSINTPINTRLLFVLNLIPTSGSDKSHPSPSLVLRP